MASQGSPAWARIKLYYFIHFGASACIYTFIILYYQRVGMTGRQIGLLAGLRPLMVFVAAPLWGALADATGRHKRVLLVAIAMSAVLGLSFLAARTATAVFALALVFAAFEAPSVPWSTTARWPFSGTIGSSLDGCVCGARSDSSAWRPRWAGYQRRLI